LWCIRGGNDDDDDEGSTHNLLCLLLSVWTVSLGRLEAYNSDGMWKAGFVILCIHIMLISCERKGLTVTVIV